MFIHAPVFIQLLGYAAGATCSLCFVAKRDITLRLAIGIGVLLFGLQYLLLGAVTAAIINFVNSGWQFLSMVSGRFPKRLQTGLLVAVCCVYIAAGILTWEGIISLLPMVSTVGLAIAVTVLSDRRLRLALLACDALWLVTGLLTHSQGAVVFAILPLVLNGWFLIGASLLLQSCRQPCPPTKAPALRSPAFGLQLLVLLFAGRPPIQPRLSSLGFLWWQICHHLQWA